MPKHLLKHPLKRVQHLLLPLLLLLLRSSFLLSSRACRKRKERAASSTPSAAGAAKAGRATDGARAATYPSVTGSDTFTRGAGRVPELAVFCPEELSGRRSTLHPGCDARPRQAP